MKNVLIKLPASSSTAIVPPHLISSIDTAHVLIVADDNRILVPSFCRLSTDPASVG